MTQRITIGFVGADYSTISAALAALPATPFTETTVFEVHADTLAENIVIPDTIQPTASLPLIIWALRGPAVASPFSPVTIEYGGPGQVDPPQPRLQRPTLLSLTINSDNVQVDGFLITGMVNINANSGVVLNGNILESGNISITRTPPAAGSIRISNNEIRKAETPSAVIVSGYSGLKLYHNTILMRREDASSTTTPSYALNIIDSDVEAKNNLLTAMGEAFAVRFVGDPSGSVFEYNHYAVFDESGVCAENPLPFTYSDSPLTAERKGALSSWPQFMASSSNESGGNPDFREVHGTDVDLDVSNLSIVTAKAPAISGIRNDVRSERRPLDWVTIGAHDHSEVITNQGKQRFLEIISGLSNQPVTKTVLAKSGDSTLFGEYNAPTPDDDTIDPLFTPIAMDDPYAVGDGTVIFRPHFQVTQPIYGQMIDAVADRADELALLGNDNLIFLIKRMHSIPFDSTGFLHTQVQIPITIVDHDIAEIS